MRGTGHTHEPGPFWNGAGMTFMVPPAVSTTNGVLHAVKEQVFTWRCWNEDDGTYVCDDRNKQQ